jgi:hypothetical protein
VHKRIVLSALLVAFIVTDADAQNRFHRRRGAIFGGLAGAAVGAVIGDKGDNETAGALIGGAVGAVAGGAIGDQKDRRIQQQHYHHHQTRHYQQQLSAQQAQQQATVDWQTQQQIARAVSMEDVVTMVRRGLGEATVMQYVRVNGVRHRLSVGDIINLHQQGVSEAVINAMQSAPVYGEPTPIVLGTDGYPTSQTRDMTQGGEYYGPNVITPQNPQLQGRPIDPTKPYIFPSAN